MLYRHGQIASDFFFDFWSIFLVYVTLSALVCRQFGARLDHLEANFGWGKLEYNVNINNLWFVGRILLRNVFSAERSRDFPCL